MPAVVRREENAWVVIDKRTGRRKTKKLKSKAKAEAYARIVNQWAEEHGEL